MANKYVSVTARIIPNERDSSLDLGVYLNDGDVPTGASTFGIQLTPLGSMPFALSSAGVIDFGSAYDLQQYGETDFCSKRITLGCCFNWDAHGESDAYEIVRIIEHKL